jgi:CheY-like chemotaxis protein
MMQLGENLGPRRVILIADDKQSNRELLRAILERARYVVVEAADGDQAIMVASEANPHLIILDIHMPKKDGFGVIRELRKDPDFRALPIMALTASASLDEQDRIIGSGFDACLVKPIGPAKLRDTVASLLQPGINHLKYRCERDG